MMQPRKTIAIKLYQTINSDLFRSLELANTFVLVTDTGLPKAKDSIAIEELSRKMAFALFAANKNIDKKRSSVLHRKASESSKDKFEKALRSVDAAKVVVAHTILDWVTTELCKVCIYSDPNYWLLKLKSKIDISKLILSRKNQERILWDELAQFSKTIGNDSLKNRVKLIEQNCRPKCTDKFAFKAPKIDLVDQLDKLRHEIIHKNWLNRGDRISFDPVVILRRHASYLSYLVSEAHHLRAKSRKGRIALAIIKLNMEVP